MLKRHLPAERRGALREFAGTMATPIALWRSVRRDPVLLLRSPQVVDRLARRLSARQGRARLRAEEARGYDLNDLAAADRWWKHLWWEAQENTER